MQPEIFGSFLVFGAAPILLEANKHSKLLTLGLATLIFVMLYFSLPQVAVFPIGLCLAIFLPRRGALPPVIGYPALLFSFYLLGYPARAVGIYSIFGFLGSNPMPFGYPQIVGAAILISVIETFPTIRRPLSGRFSVFLGKLSFPIYLLHMLVICSVGSKIYLMAGAVPAIATVFVVSVLASLPLIGFNTWWVNHVNLVTDFLLRTESPVMRNSGRVPSDLGIIMPASKPDDLAPQ
jgi:peptidoglycan/LPS O-acetylase OafA/YrhL